MGKGANGENSKGRSVNKGDEGYSRERWVQKCGTLKVLPQWGKKLAKN